MQVGKTNASKSVRYVLNNSGETDTGMPRSRMLLHLKRSSKSRTLAANLVTFSSRAENQLRCCEIWQIPQYFSLRAPSWKPMI